MDDKTGKVLMAKTKLELVEEVAALRAIVRRLEDRLVKIKKEGENDGIRYRDLVNGKDAAIQDLRAELDSWKRENRALVITIRALVDSEEDEDYHAR